MKFVFDIILIYLFFWFGDKIFVDSNFESVDNNFFPGTVLNSIVFTGTVIFFLGTGTGTKCLGKKIEKLK